MPTAMRKQRRGPRRNCVSWKIKSVQDVLDSLSLLLFCTANKCWANVLDRVAEQASLGDGSIKKAHFVNNSHLN